MMVNASKNLFDSDTSKLAITAHSAYHDYSRKTMKLAQTRPSLLSQLNKTQQEHKAQLPRNNSLVKGQNYAAGCNSSTFKNLASKEQKLRDQKNVAILSQSMKQRQRINFEPHGARPVQSTNLKTS